MSSTFHGLNTTYSGLSASQRQVETTSHNISNANNPYYTRQRAVQANKVPMNDSFGDLGTGTKIMTIKRVHDEFVYERYRRATEHKEASDVTKNTMKEVSQYFPDMQDLGIFKDLREYFNGWADLSSNPTQTAQKEALKSKAEILTTDIKATRAELHDTQLELNSQMGVMINEANSLLKQIAQINVKIRNNESDKTNNANDLRDQRDKLELALSKIMDIKVFKSAIKSDNTMLSNNADWNEDYVLNVGGYTLIDENGSHGIKFDTKDNPYGFGKVKFVREDLSEYDMSKDVRGGKIGAMLDLRGRVMDERDGEFMDGQLQSYIDNLDTFAKGLIEHTNAIYSKSSQKEIRSNTLPISKEVNILNLDKTTLNLKEGEFDIVIYDTNGKEIGRKTIDIDENTSMKTLVKSINKNSDDNADGSPLNDVDDMFTARFANGKFTITRDDDSKGHTIAIEDSKTKPTNISGVFGLNRFFEGNNAKNITLNRKILDDSVEIRAGLNAISGDATVANDMQQLQFDKIEFMDKHGKTTDETLNFFFNIITTKIATDGDEANSYSDTKTAMFNTIKNEFEAISKVSMDEELTELMKFQTAYQANAKVMSTINTILETLLGIKR